MSVMTMTTEELKAARIALEEDLAQRLKYFQTRTGLFPTSVTLHAEPHSVALRSPVAVHSVSVNVELPY